MTGVNLNQSDQLSLVNNKLHLIVTLLAANHDDVDVDDILMT